MLLGYKKYWSSRYLGSLGNPSGGSRDKEELQTHAKMIRIQKYHKYILNIEFMIIYIYIYIWTRYILLETMISYIWLWTIWLWIDSNTQTNGGYSLVLWYLNQWRLFIGTLIPKSMGVVHWYFDTQTNGGYSLVLWYLANGDYSLVL